MSAAHAFVTLSEAKHLCTKGFFIIMFLPFIIKLDAQSRSFQINKRQNKIYEYSSGSGNNNTYVIYEKIGEDSLTAKAIHRNISMDALYDSLKKAGFSFRYKMDDYKRKCTFRITCSNIVFDKIDLELKDSIFKFDLQINLSSEKPKFNKTYIFRGIMTKLNRSVLLKSIQNFNYWDIIHYRGTRLYRFSVNLSGIYYSGCNHCVIYSPFYPFEYFYK